MKLPPDKVEDGQVFFMTVAGHYVGRIVINSQLNVEADELVVGLREAGVSRCVLLTEDGNAESRRLAEEMDFSEVYGECDTEKEAPRGLGAQNERERLRVVCLRLRRRDAQRRGRGYTCEPKREICRCACIAGVSGKSSVCRADMPPYARDRHRKRGVRVRCEKPFWCF